MGRWRGATFKEYIREQLACYSEGMTQAMKRIFKFVNVHGNSYYDVTSTCALSEYANALVLEVIFTNPHNKRPAMNDIIIK